MTQALRLENLKVAFAGPHGVIRAVEGIDLSIDQGECLALVGESGCGKSVTSLAALKLLDPAACVIRADRHMLLDTDIRTAGERQMSQLRGKRAAMIFQDALSALNPVMTVGEQLDEIFRIHFHSSRKDARCRSIEALRMVGIPDAEARYRAYPHELSGGMRQRVLIAMAFACKPALIIADEPTTALDVTIQAQILELLKRLQKQHNTALLLITHDLSVVAHMADRIAVMYSGKIVEIASARELILKPQHPYTRGLLSAVVQLGDETERFTQIPGALPDPAHKPMACYFQPRCSDAMECCSKCRPALRECSEGHWVRCFLKEGCTDE